MSNIKGSVDVDVPVRTAYDQWTQFESFPQFMEGVESIEQVTDTRNRWTVEGDSGHAGVVSFHHLDEGKCRVNLDMDVNPEGFVEQLGDKLGFISRRVHGDMERFKTFIESRGSETGAWRGTVDRAS